MVLDPRYYFKVHGTVSAVVVVQTYILQAVGSYLLEIISRCMTLSVPLW